MTIKADWSATPAQIREATSIPNIFRRRDALILSAYCVGIVILMVLSVLMN